MAINPGNPGKELPSTPPAPKANSSERPREKAQNWLPPAATKSDPQGTAGVNIGPSSPHWRKTERGARK
jgi:hypothetical protein